MKGKGLLVAHVSGIENHLFYADNTQMLCGDGQKRLEAINVG